MSCTPVTLAHIYRRPAVVTREVVAVNWMKLYSQVGQMHARVDLRYCIVSSNLRSKIGLGVAR